MLIVTSLLAFACAMLQSGLEHTAPEHKWDVRGHLTKLVLADKVASQSGVLAFCLVEGTIEPDTIYAKAAVTVTIKTRIVEEHDGSEHRVRFDSLKIGQTVQVRFVAPALQSSPVQATAREILVLK
jgi:hypothetical protein